MASPHDDEALISFKYSLDIGGKIAGYFTECSGLNIEYDAASLKVVNEKGVPMVLQQPGRIKYTDIVLKRGITKNVDMWKWRQEIEEGRIESARVNGTITMLAADGSEAAKWNFENAWPSKITGPQAKSDSNEYGVEEITLVHEFLYREAM